MSRPPTIPGHPKKRWVVYVTDRTRQFIEQRAAAKKQTVGDYLDRNYGNSRLGGWNDE